MLKLNMTMLEIDKSLIHSRSKCLALMKDLDTKIFTKEEYLTDLNESMLHLGIKETNLKYSTIIYIYIYIIIEVSRLEENVSHLADIYNTIQYKDQLQEEIKQLELRQYNLSKPPANDRVIYFYSVIIYIYRCKCS